MVYKLKLLVQNLRIFHSQRTFSNISDIGKHKWDLYVGVLVERLPVLSKEFNSIERDFQNYLTQIEYEKSLKSDFELRHERELKQNEILKKDGANVDLDEVATKQTVQDLKDAYNDELNKCVFASRFTNDDKINNITSINRCLDDILYLIVKQTLGNNNYYLLPQGQHKEGETLRQTAERILKERCGSQMQVQFYGNIPCGFYKYKYPKSITSKSTGGKIFFYRASLKSGNVEKAVTGDYEWLKKENLSEKLNNLSYLESILKIIL